MAQRKLQISISGDLPLDGYKAALERIRVMEKDIAEGRTVPTVDSGATVPDAPILIVATSLSAYEAYRFNIVDLDPVAGVYNLELVSIGI